MLGCLAKCLAADSVPTALDMAVDVILTLQVPPNGPHAHTSCFGPCGASHSW